MARLAQGVELLADTGQIWRFGVFEVDMRRDELRRSGSSVKMREQSFRVLVYLLEHQGEIVTREELRRVLWPADTFVDFDHSLNTAVMKLRDVLGDVADAPIYIETIPKRGYRFIAAVRADPSNGAAPGLHEAMGSAHDAVVTEAASQIAVEGAPPPARVSWGYLVIGVVLLAAVASITFARIWSARRATPSIAVEQRLTANPPEAPITGASISPDGKYVAYSDPTGVYLRQMEGGETRPLSLPQGSSAAPAGWFPDSIHLLVDIEGVGGSVTNLWKVSILGGSPQEIVENARGGVVSPSGQKIAFLRTASEVFEIWAADNDGSNPKRIVEDAGPEDLRGIGTIVTHPLYSGLISRLAWSPDGNRIAYIRGFVPAYADLATENRCALETVDTNDGTRNRVMESAQLRPAVSWSADGRLLYAYRDDNADRSDIGIWSVRANEKTGAKEGIPRQLTRGAGRIGGISVGAKGKRLVLWRSNTQPTVLVADLDPSTRHFKTPRRFTLNENGNVAAAWTPDSRAVLFASNRDGNWKIFRQAIDRTTPEVVADGGRSRDFLLPRMNPDGTEILYLAPYDLRAPEPDGDVMSVPLQGGARRVVLQKASGNIQCARVPSNLCLISVTSGSIMKFFSFDPEKGTTQEFGRFKIDHTLNWSLSPDGSQLAMLPVPGSKITFMTLSDRRTHDVELKGWADLNTIDWTGDGRSVYVTARTSHGTDEVVQVEPSGMNHVVLESDSHTHFWWAIQSPDGQHIIVQAVTGENNVWMVENF